MKTRIHVANPAFPHGPRVPVRTIKIDGGARDRLPDCAWCRLPHLKPVCDITQHGFQWDFVQLVCHCDHCKNGTVIEFECPAERYE